MIPSELIPQHSPPIRAAKRIREAIQHISHISYPTAIATSHLSSAARNSFLGSPEHWACPTAVHSAVGTLPPTPVTLRYALEMCRSDMKEATDEMLAPSVLWLERCAAAVFGDYSKAAVHWTGIVPAFLSESVCESQKLIGAINMYALSTVAEREAKGLNGSHGAQFVSWLDSVPLKAGKLKSCACGTLDNPSCRYVEIDNSTTYYRYEGRPPTSVIDDEVVSDVLMGKAVELTADIADCLADLRPPAEAIERGDIGCLRSTKGPNIRSWEGVARVILHKAKESEQLS